MGDPALRIQYSRNTLMPMFMLAHLAVAEPAARARRGARVLDGADGGGAAAAADAAAAAGWAAGDPAGRQRGRGL